LAGKGGISTVEGRIHDRSAPAPLKKAPKAHQTSQIKDLIFPFDIDHKFSVGST
jgi:hypothetical protein